MHKIRVGVVFGGKSSEHEISLLSARSIIDALDREKYEVVLISIDKQGCWHMRDPLTYLRNPDDPKAICLDGEEKAVTVNQGMVDVVFPVLHGRYGEDGAVQGLLKMAGIPFVGADILGSAIGMDKDVAKRLLLQAGLPVGKFIAIHAFEKDRYKFCDLAESLGLPLFIKPACEGSSVGVSKVQTEQEFEKALQLAFLYDQKILVEEYIPGREIECAVLGNDFPQASLPGEIIPQHEFYSYEAKYLDEEGAHFKIPVHLPPELIKRVQELSIRAFQVLCCRGMARVDFFLTQQGQLYINEINTIPGFTKISMYPKLWQVSGIPYPELLDRLIALATEGRSFQSLEKIILEKDHEQSTTFSPIQSRDWAR